MTEIEFHRFANEVLTGSPELCLPRNLSDEWLEAIADDIAGYHEAVETSTPDTVTPIPPSVVGPVMRISAEQQGNAPQVELAYSTILEYCACYDFAISAEQLHRRGWITLVPPPLKDYWEGEAKFKIHEERIPLDHLLWVKARLGALPQ